MHRDAVQAFSNVQDGVHYAQAAKNILAGQAWNSSGSSNPVSDTTQEATTESVAATTLVTSDDATGTILTGTVITETGVTETIATGTIVAGDSIAEPTTLQTVTYNQYTTGDVSAQVISGYPSSIRRYLISSTETQTSTATGATMTSSIDLSSGFCASGTFDCVDDQLAQCMNGQLVLISCVSGTICAKIDVGGGNVVVKCDY